MRHNFHDPDFPFVRQPIEFDKTTDKDTLQYCLGGTLYMPGTRDVVDKILERRLDDVTSMVMCFEDAIAAEDLPAAEDNVLRHLETIADALRDGRIAIGDVPLIFLRARNTEQFDAFAGRLTPRHASVLTGFVFPKFYSANARSYLDRLDAVATDTGAALYCMPLLEGPSIAHRETRLDELLALKKLLEDYRERVLNVRVGGTDFSSIFSVRRGINSSIYDIVTVRDCLADILNVFGRASDGYVVSGPVWEYFLAHKKDDLDKLRTGSIHRSLLNPDPILNEAIDGLLREVILDRANGFVGKTVIHPSHLKYVNGLQAVTREEYEDAQQILDRSGGVVKSGRANKMNEVSPHRNWANKIVRCADAYGVIEDEGAYLPLCLS